MKVLIVSDTHRQNRNLFDLMKKIGSIDLLIHLGDAEGSEDEIKLEAKCPVAMVAGNNDFFSGLDKEIELQIGKYRVLLTHGHFYYVTVGTENIKKEAISRQFDIVMFGHTHRPLLEIEDKIIALNPGSLSYPRQDGRMSTYAIMEIDDKGEAHFTINEYKKC
ncbi:metallophosphoesterase family protein [Candidatus Galacturonibacter soehngenii]|uniref:Phosphoesterase n=1 Tax=Candidatus Galacturonatibacter soehngenii TaxID=2307010 RepID=A0A7V7UDP7_9FIRM|nr:metallophosphoesterase [Candidatus Galacturonibacter soehngenii]KAB1440952.1 metallophosphoesterase [Candidatus Galacturonibacter soehngenii]